MELKFLLHFFFLRLFLLLLILRTTIAAVAADAGSTSRIGVVLDLRYRRGKEAKIAVDVAAHEDENHQKLDVYVKDTNGNPLRLASTISGLMKDHNVTAIIGDLTKQEAAMLEDVYGEAMVPLISLTESLPIPTSQNLKQPTPMIGIGTDISSEMKCIAAIVESHHWRRVIAVYEDNPFADDSGVINLLWDSLRAVESQVEQRAALPSFSSLSDPAAVIREELLKLRRNQCKVFVLLRSSLPMAKLLFSEAKRIGMLSDGYAWIIGEDVAGLLDSINSTLIAASMQGVVGVKNHFSENSNSFRAFSSKFRRRCRSEYPDEVNCEPGIHALRAYDAVFAISFYSKNSSLQENGFTGLSGMHIKDGKLAADTVFRIVNVVGKSYREMGLWSEKKAFHKDGDMRDCSNKNGLWEEDEEEGASCGRSMEALGPVYWPGGTRQAPRGWMAKAAGHGQRALRIGVPAMAAFKPFVKVEKANGVTIVSGFSIDVFRTVVDRLPYRLPYEFRPYYGSYDDLVRNVYAKEFDGAIGDFEIMADRYKLVEFSQPYVESGLVMVVKEKPVGEWRKAWQFPAPFTASLWLCIAAITIFTGFVVSVIEHVEQNEEFGYGKTWGEKTCTALWFAFCTFVFAHREKLKSKLSRLVVVTWLFVALVLNSSFTATLTTMLTVSQLEPTIVSIDTLKHSHAAVGCNGNSFIVRYLVDVLGFNYNNIRKIKSIDEYPDALRSGEIAAAFFVEPHAKLFLSINCRGFTIAGPSYKLGGFGFVFPKGSPLAMDISEAILQANEEGEIQRLEKSLLGSSSCSSQGAEDDKGRLNPEALVGIFVITVTISSSALLYTAYANFREQLKTWILEVVTSIKNWFLKFPSEISRLLKRSNVRLSGGNVQDG